MSFVRNLTIIVIAHKMQQAVHIAQQVAFFHLVNLSNRGMPSRFIAPQQRLTQDRAGSLATR